MKLINKTFEAPYVTLYPLGDFHIGSSQYNEALVLKVIRLIKDDPSAVWCGMGDLMENAIIGTLGDVYNQILPPKEQLEYICSLFEPIREKCLFLIAGNHEQRTQRLVGILPELFIAYRLNVPFVGFSAFLKLNLCYKTVVTSYSCYFHHNSGGGYSFGGKVNKAGQLRLIAPTVDAIFSAHFHITSRIPVTWFEPGNISVKNVLAMIIALGQH